MLDFNELNQAEKTAKPHEAQRELQFQQHLKNARKEIELFNLDFDKYFLEGAVTELLAALIYKKNNAEVHCYLAYAMFLVDDNPKGFAYLQQARNLNPDFPMIAKIQAVIGGKDDLVSENMQAELAFMTQSGFF